MNTVVSFKTPNGEDMIVLAKSDYDALVERAELAEDIAAVDAYQRKLQTGEEEAIPEEFADRLIDGENPIRVYRELRGMSARELAEKTGISAAFLSEIENGKKEGGVATLKKIAQVLRVTTRPARPDQDTAGRVWVRERDGTLRPIDVRLGLSDGTYTELLQDNLEIGTELVTTVGLPGIESAPTTPARTGGS